MSQTATRQRWSALVEAQAHSGLTTRQFAHQHDVNAGTLAWWRTRLRKAQDSAPSTAVAMEFRELEVAPRAPLTLNIDGWGASIVVDDDTDLGLLRRLLDALC